MELVAYRTQTTVPKTTKKLTKIMSSKDIKNNVQFRQAISIDGISKFFWR